MFKAIARTDNNAAQLFIRLALGLVMLPHGVQKVFGLFGGPGFEATIAIFAKMGYPAWAVILLMIVELPGAACLILGFLTRLWALGLGVSITICMFQNHVQHGFFMNWFGRQQGEGYEFHLLVIGMALALLAGGGGMLSIDRTLAPKRKPNPLF